MANQIEPIQRMVSELARLPGIGQKTAQRLAYHIVGLPLEEVHALARAFGCTDLQLTVYPQNDAAIAFYQKCGFTIKSIDMQRKV